MNVIFVLYCIAYRLAENAPDKTLPKEDRATAMGMIKLAGPNM